MNQHDLKEIPPGGSQAISDNKDERTAVSLAQAQRIQFIDMSRFYGMVLVYYGHFITGAMEINYKLGSLQYKFIYSFHMVLFILIAGYISKESDVQLNLRAFLKNRFYTRFVPLAFFNILLLVPAFYIPGNFWPLDLTNRNSYLFGIFSTLRGVTVFNAPTWFLVLLISVEVIHYTTFRYLKSNTRILIAALIFYITGYILNWKHVFYSPGIQGYVGWNYFHFHEAIIVYAFYLLGIYLRRKKFLIEDMNPGLLVSGLLISLFMVLFTFNLNDGPFRFPPPLNCVILEYSEHGNMILFPITAIAGSLFILFLAKLTPINNIAMNMGQNALILFGLNGVFFHFINGRVAHWILNKVPNDTFTIFGVSSLVTVASLALCVPFIMIFNKYIPQLVGKPKIKGPILNNFI